MPANSHEPAAPGKSQPLRRAHHALDIDAVAMLERAAIVDGERNHWQLEAPVRKHPVRQSHRRQRLHACLLQPAEIGAMPHHTRVIRVLGQHTAGQAPGPGRIKSVHYDLDRAGLLAPGAGHRLILNRDAPVFRNLLIADSGKGHVEEMVRMLRDLPAFRQARLNLLHVVPEQSGETVQEHWQRAGGLIAEAVQRLGLNPTDVNTIIRQGDAKQTVLKVAEELDADLIVMGSRGLGRLQSILANSSSQYVFQLSTRPMLLVRDDLYVRHVNRVMVTIDGTGVGDDALKIACELVR